jgi:hypothetical protein
MRRENHQIFAKEEEAGDQYKLFKEENHEYEEELPQEAEEYK